MSNITPAISDNAPIKIILADNDVEVCTLFKLILERAGYPCNCAWDHQEVLSSLKNGLVDLLLMEGSWLDNWYRYHKKSFLEGEQYLYNVGVIVYIRRNADIPSSTFIDVRVSKPFEIKHLLQTLKDVLRKYGKLPPT